jgi:hypothetical protein
MTEPTHPSDASLNHADPRQLADDLNVDVVLDDLPTPIAVSRTATGHGTDSTATAAAPHRAMSADEIRALGTTTSLTTAAALFGLSRATAYRLAQAGTFPVPIIRAGSQYRVPVAPILALLHPDVSPDTIHRSA